MKYSCWRRWRAFAEGWKKYRCNKLHELLYYVEHLHVAFRGTVLAYLLEAAPDKQAKEIKTQANRKHQLCCASSAEIWSEQVDWIWIHVKIKVPSVVTFNERKSSADACDLIRNVETRTAHEAHENALYDWWCSHRLSLCLSIKHVRDNPKLSIGKCKYLMFFSGAVDPAQQFTYLLIIEWTKRTNIATTVFRQNISTGRWCENNCRLTMHCEFVLRLIVDLISRAVTPPTVITKLLIEASEPPSTCNSTVMQCVRQLRHFSICCREPPPTESVWLFHE